MNKQELAAKIWESANKMRSTIEASQYKDYILGFIFYKFLSETEIARLKAEGMSDSDLTALTEDNVDAVKLTQDYCGYFIAYENLFQTWLEKGKDFEISDVRDALSAFERNIEPNHRKLFDNIFETLHTGLSKLGTDSKSQTKAVRDLIHLIKDIPMSGSQSYDTLGYTYEYLIEKFAMNAGKKAGEFYTPHEVSQVMSQIIAHELEGRSEIQIYDPTSGSGSLLITIGEAFARKNGDVNKIKYFAQEIKENTYNLTRMNLVMRGIKPSNIYVRNGDTLEDDWPYFDTNENKEETYDPLFVDAVVSNPPYSQAWNTEDKDMDVRFAYGLAPKKKADYAFLLHDLYHLRNDGIMCIVLPHGVLFRGNEESKIRRNLIEHRNIQAIIGLPANIFYGTGIPTIIMVLRKERVAQDSSVLVVDASKHFIKDGKNNRLQESDIKRIVDVVTNNATVEGYSRLVSIDEIRANDYNLNIPRYVDSSEAPETWDIYATMFGGIPTADLERFENYWSAWPSLKEELFLDQGACVVTPKAKDLHTSVYENKEVSHFISSFKAALETLPAYVSEYLVAKLEIVAANKAKEDLADKIQELLSPLPLIDQYKVYQKFHDQWVDIARDIETIQTDGITALCAVDPNMVFKPKKKIVVQEGWVGRVLPFDLVQEHCFPAELNAIARTENRLVGIDQELSDLLDTLEEDEKQISPVISEDGDSFVTKELKSYVSSLKNKADSHFDEVCLAAKSLNTKRSAAKNEAKELKASLHEQTKDCIESLPRDEALALLEIKWTEPLLRELNELPVQVVNNFISQMKDLYSKYETTYADVCTQIEEAEAELAGMLDDLVGNEFDMAGIADLKKLLGGE